MNPRDPGWGPSLKGIAFALVPVAGPLLMRKRAPQSGLTALRTIFVSFVTSMLLMWFVLSFIAPFGSGFDGPPGRWALFVVGFWAAGQIFATTILRRPLPAESPNALAGAYRTRLFLVIALSESAALMAFVGVFIAGEAWVFVVGLVLALLGMSRVAPTASSLERIDADLRGRAAFSIYDALEQPGPEAAGR